jgi:hypothetical protein
MSPIAHSGVALLGWELFSTRKTAKSFLIFFLIANIPDVDFFLFLVFGRSRLSLHQYVTHNLVFVLVVAGLFSLLLPAARDRWGLILVGLSHLVLDLIVIDPAIPIGIRLFFPFSKKVFNLGFFPHLERGGFSNWFSGKNLLIMGLEAAVFVAPVLVLFGRDLVRTVKSRAFWTL